MSIDIQHWEYLTTTGGPIVGATVNLRVASASHPNAGAITNTTTTDANGMWQFAGLADTQAYDVEVATGGVSRWYKGLSKFSALLQAGNFAAQAPNTFLSGPGSGGSAIPSWRAMLNADLPAFITARNIVDPTDTTKALGFSLSGATSGKSTTFSFTHTNNRVIAFPDTSDTVVCRSTTDTLVNKALTQPAIADFTQAPHSHSSTATGGFTTHDECRVYNSVTQATVTGTPLTLGFDREDSDTAVFHDLVTANSRLTVPRTGKYRVYANILWAINGTGFREANLVKNSTVYLHRNIIPSAGASNYTGHSLYWEGSLAAGDYVEVTVQQGSGGNLNVNAGAAGSPQFGIAYAGS